MKESVCKSVFKTGNETTKETFTAAMARVIMRAENSKSTAVQKVAAKQNKRTDT